MKYNQLTWIVCALALAACTAAPVKKEDGKVSGPSASERKSYLQGYEVIKSDQAPRETSCPSQASSIKGLNWKQIVPYANACVAQKNWKNLETVAFAMTRAEMNSPWGLYYLSLSAENLGEPARALWMIDAAIKRSSDRVALFLYQRGHIFATMKQTQKAIEEFEKALAEDTRFLDAHLFIAQTYAADRDFERSLAHFKKALSIEPKSLEAMTGLAECKIAMNLPKEAVEYLEMAVQTHPSYLAPRVRLAGVYEELLNNAEQALSIYRALRIALLSGQVKEQPSFDINEKIKLLESSVQSVTTRKQASTSAPGLKGEVK